MQHISMAVTVKFTRSGDWETKIDWSRLPSLADEIALTEALADLVRMRRAEEARAA